MLSRGSLTFRVGRGNVPFNIPLVGGFDTYQVQQAVAGWFSPNAAAIRISLISSAARVPRARGLLGRGVTIWAVALPIIFARNTGRKATVA